MDRTVDLEAVLAGGTASPPAPAPPASGSAAPARRVAPGPTSERASEAGSSRPAVAPPPPAGAPPPAASPSSAPLAQLWPDIVAEVRSRSRFLGEALAATSPKPAQDGVLDVVLGEPNPLFAERLQTEARAVEDVIRRLSGQGVRLRVTEAAPEGAPAPRRLTEASLKADRLRSFRAKDPSLDTAADALDLEIVDEV
jgi:hypothetical protein